jgi:hypothetical protein
MLIVMSPAAAAYIFVSLRNVTLIDEDISIANETTRYFALFIISPT